MFDQTTTFVLNILSEDKKTATPYMIVGMKMHEFPNTTIKEITIYKDTVEQTVQYDPRNMIIQESPTDAIVKIRIHTEKVMVQCNRIMNNIEVFGIIELGKSQINKSMFDQASMVQAVQN